MIRVFAVKSFLFTRGDEKVKVRNQEIAEVPNWAADTQLFKLAKIDGNIQVLSSKSEEKQVEKDATTAKKVEEKKEKEEKKIEKKEDKEKSSTDKK